VVDRAVLLTPGAGTDASHPSLLAIERVLAPVPVRRLDFPYRLAGRKAPDRPPRLIAAVEEAAAELAAETGLDPARIVLGGRSMGGRMCSMAVAGGLPALGLVLVAYPLHPPGRPDRLRIEHLPDLAVPCLFVSGTRDPFASPEELTSHVAAIAGPVTLRFLEGKRHDLRGADGEIADLVAAWVRELPESA